MYRRRSVGRETLKHDLLLRDHVVCHDRSRVLHVRARRAPGDRGDRAARRL